MIDREHGWTLITDASPGIQVRDMHDGHQIAQIPVTPEENDMRATELPRGSAVLLVNPPTGASYLLDTTTWTMQPAPFRKGEVIWAVFSGDGSALATAASNGEITIREGHTFKVLRRLGVTDELSPWLPMAFSDDARFLVTVHPAGGRLWDFDVDQWPAIACRAAGRNLTSAGWDQLGPRDEPYRATCTEWPSAA